MNMKNKQNNNSLSPVSKDSESESFTPKSEAKVLPEKVSGTIELRSDEIQEILNRPPHALIRYGISVVCGFLIVLFVGSFYFRYPDNIQGDILITTENPPVWIVAKSSGKIKELLCSDKQEVKKGDVLAVIDNSASTKDVLAIQKLLTEITITDSTLNIPKNIFSQSHELGTLQPVFSGFIKASTNYENFLTLNITQQEKLSVRKQIEKRKSYLANLQKQMEMKKRELAISKSGYDRDKTLFSQKIISASEMETAEQTYLSKQQEYQQIQTTISLQNVEFLQLKESVNKLSIQYSQDKNQLLSELKSSLLELQAGIENWHQNYLLSASEPGVVTFNSFWKQNQFINSGDKAFAIVSHHQGRLVGKIKIRSTGSGKVHIGQSVNIRVAGYPYLEYGLLQAQIKSISLVSTNDYFSVEVAFPKGLHTTSGKDLKFTGELNGTAEIITENRSIIERIYSPIQYFLLKWFN